MRRLPSEIKLSDHARQRLEERRQSGEILDTDISVYNTKNIMRSSVRWYTKDDLIFDCALYRHCCYTTRQSKDVAYITDGNIEVIYDKSTKVGITVLQVKDKFKPITQYIKPEVLREIEIKKENRKMKRLEIGTCPDCGKTDVKITSRGVCATCRKRQDNMRTRGREYIPYSKLSEYEQKRIDCLHKKHNRSKKEVVIEVPEISKTIPVIENYYQVKAENNPNIAHTVIKPVTIQNTLSPLSDQDYFVKILRECGCNIPTENLENVLDMLIKTNEIKDILKDNQQILSSLETTLNITEKTLQNSWESNGFQKDDDIKFKNFLTWRRILKEAMSFWKIS